MPRFQFALLSAILGILGILSPSSVDAQVVRGNVRTVGGSLPIAAVQVLLRDTLGRVLGVTTSDEQGLFSLRLESGLPFSVRARRLGYQMAESGVLRFTASDTVDLEFLLFEVSVGLDAVEVSGMPNLNDLRLEDAERRGWVVYSPETVGLHRDRVNDLESLLRTMATQGLIVPRNPRECIRSVRTNRCVTYIVDGQVLGTEPIFVLPRDIYFMAVLSPSQSRAQYGGRANDGAIAIFTRARGDRTDRPAPPQPRRPPTTSSTRPPTERP